MHTPEDVKLEAPQTPWWRNPVITVPIAGAIIGAIAVNSVEIINRPSPPAPPKDVPAARGKATTFGADSPANTGSGNTFTYGDMSKKGK